MLSKIQVSPAPHISGRLSTQRVMLDVIIGLVPAMAAAAVYFRERALLVIAVSVASCVAAEWICNRIRKRPNTLGDLSAVVTGVILAMSLPPAVPLSVVVIGGFFAVVIAKVLFGGLGSNVFNPAMAARAFLAVSFGAAMTTWTVPATMEGGLQPVTAANTQATTQATPLAWSKMVQKDQAEPKTANWMIQEAFLGNVGGCLGETSSLALLLGGAYLLWRKTITWHVPAAVLGAAALFAGVMWLANRDDVVSPLLHLFGGGLMFCAFFIATDPVTNPLTIKGSLLFGAGVGLLVMLIRVVGEYPEGVMYAVLLMNAFTPLIDRFCRRTPLGGVPDAKKS